MAARLGSDTIIMHVPIGYSAPLRRSLDELVPYAKDRNVRIAIENGDFETIGSLLSDYGPEYLGLCYDSGHGNLGDGKGLDHLDRLKERLISIHLHDNDGRSDQHNLLFSGTINWDRLARILAESSYTKCVSMESVIRNTGLHDAHTFLEKAFETGYAFSRMVEAKRTGNDR